VLERGTLLRLGGVCQTKRLPLQENLPATFAFQLWISSAADVEVIQLPPWWTVQRVFVLCGALLVMGILSAGWVALLRRQVARQTAVIGQQRERQAVAEERTRIARELHDSLGQELVGIALQLDSAAARLTTSPVQAGQALDMARVMVRHSQAETKRSVQDLRAQDPGSIDLPSALEDVVQPLVATAGATQLHMEIVGTPRRLAGVTEHHLLRIGQEAVANAVRHAQAANLRVTLRYEAGEVGLEVVDDGRGFDTDEALAIASGHFGLLGLRERANKLQGRLRIESRPGAGTTIAVSVPVS
jgi:signal transduction histidine kinase